MIEHPRIQHEMLNLLNIGINYTILLKDYLRDEKQSELITRISSSLYGIVEIIDILVFLEEIDKNKYLPVPELFNLFELISKSIEDLKKENIEHHTHYNVDVNISRNLNIKKDKRLISFLIKAFLHMCMRDLKVDSGLQVDLEPGSSYSPFVLKMIYYVRSGYSLADLHLLWASPMDSKLPLQLVMRIIAAQRAIRELKGQVRIYQEEGGPSIEVMVPLQQEEVYLPDIPVDPMLLQKRGQQKVILTDTDPVSRVLLTALLQKFGYTTSFLSLQELISSKQADLRGNILFLDDLFMGPYLERLKTLFEQNPLAVVIFVTGIHNRQSFELETGYVFRIPKPITPENLIEALEQIRGIAQAQAEIEPGQTGAEPSPATLDAQKFTYLIDLLEKGKRSEAIQYLDGLPLGKNLKEQILHEIQSFEYKKAIGMIKDVGKKTATNSNVSG